MLVGRRPTILRNERRPNVQQPRHHRAKPLDDEMHAYNSKDLERLFGLPASAVRSLARAGHISPIKRAGRLHYSFQDLLMMRTASALRAANISAHRINRTLQSFRETLPTGAASNQRSLTAMGNQIAIREGKMLWESASGQYALDLGEDKGELHVISRPVPAVPVGKSADELYAQAFALEDADPDAACAAYEVTLEADPQHVEARINLGRLLHMAGRLAEAERVYLEASKPESLIVFNLAVVLEDLKREPDAIAAYRESLALDPGLADAHFNLARLYERAKNPKASLRHLLAYRRMMDRQGT
jgi:tetratricopeptide (TPR) repeat protein